MSTNLQTIPSGLIAIQPFIDVEIITIFSPFPTNEAGTESVIQNNNFLNAPSIFIDGILLTYVPLSDRRYVEYDPETKTATIKNGTFQPGETVQIFL